MEGPKPVRISKGIPQSFMVKAEPGTKGAMLTSTGEYAIPAIDAYVLNPNIIHLLGIIFVVLINNLFCIHVFH